jgi:murein DD-endopeptidase MepM/ murein hydrolase activator NlpD
VWLVVPLALAFANSATPAIAQSGGAGAPQPPQVNTVKCVPLPDSPCQPRGAVLRGRQFVVRGARLEQVKEIVFRGGRGPSDDVATHPDTTTTGAAVAVVPTEARSGQITVRDQYGNTTTTSRRVRVADAPQASPVDVAPSSRFFFGSRRKPTISFRVAQAGSVEVQLTNVATAEVVRTWTVQAEAGVANRVTWDGRAVSGVAGAGTYGFEVVGGASTAAAEADQTSFAYADHLFPILGRHNLGYTPTNGFGGGRGHQGQDMFARCGTRLAAARGGRVEFAGYQSAAGYYVVIDGAATGTDYVYMHMRQPPLVRTGQRVFTGQQLGDVGETGHATGCHLHFELWSSPGWYKGGKAFDPLPSLKRWDGYS